MGGGEVKACFTWLLSVFLLFYRFSVLYSLLLAFGTNCSKNVFYNLPGNSLSLCFLWFLFLFAVCWFVFIVTHTHTHTVLCWLAHMAFHLASKRGGAAFCGLDWALKIYALPHKEAAEIEANSWRAQRESQWESESWHEPESKQAKPLKTRCKRKRKSRHEANKNTIANGASG